MCNLLSTTANAQASEDLARFLDYCTYGYMIDNVVLVVTGILHERDVHVRALRLYDVVGAAMKEA